MEIEEGLVVYGNLEPYCCLEVLQACLFGQVRLAVGLFTGTVVAIKCLDATEIQKIQENDEFPETPLSEIFFSFIMHDNDRFVHILEVFPRDKWHIVVCEYANGEDLIELLKQYPGGVTEEVAALTMRLAAEAVSQCHKRNVALQDFSLENCLLVCSADGTCEVKICDPGQACVFARDRNNRELQTRHCGSIGKQFRPPEIFSDQPYFASKIDSWCLGWATWYLLFATAIFEVADPTDARYVLFEQRNVSGLLAISGIQRSQASDIALDFIFRLMALDPEKRMTVTEALEHPFLTRTRNKTLSLFLFPTPAEKKDPPTAMKMAMNALCLQNVGNRYRFLLYLSYSFKVLAKAMEANQKLPRLQDAERRCQMILERRRHEGPCVPHFYYAQLMPLLCRSNKPSHTLYELAPKMSPWSYSITPRRHQGTVFIRHEGSLERGSLKQYMKEESQDNAKLRRNVPQERPVLSQKLNHSVPKRNMFTGDSYRQRIETLQNVPTVWSQGYKVQTATVPCVTIPGSLKPTVLSPEAKSSVDKPVLSVHEKPGIRVNPLRPSADLPTAKAGRRIIQSHIALSRRTPSQNWDSFRWESAVRS